MGNEISMDKATEAAILTDAPVEVEIDGIKYSAKPLVDADYVELDEWIRQQIIDTAYGAIRPNTNPILRDSLIQNAIRAAAGATWQTESGADIVNTNYGLAKIMSMALRDYATEETTISRLARSFINLQNVDSVLRYWAEMNKRMLAAYDALVASNKDSQPATVPMEKTSGN